MLFSYFLLILTSIPQIHSTIPVAAVDIGNKYIRLGVFTSETEFTHFDSTSSTFELPLMTPFASIRTYPNENMFKNEEVLADHLKNLRLQANKIYNGSITHFIFALQGSNLEQYSGNISASAKQLEFGTVVLLPTNIGYTLFFGSLYEAYHTNKTEFFHDNTVYPLANFTSSFKNFTGGHVLFIDLGTTSVRLTLAEYDFGGVQKRSSVLTSPTRPTVAVLHSATSTSISSELITRDIAVFFAHAECYAPAHQMDDVEPEMFAPGILANTIGPVVTRFCIKEADKVGAEGEALYFTAHEDEVFSMDNSTTLYQTPHDPTSPVDDYRTALRVSFRRHLERLNDTLAHFMAEVEDRHIRTQETPCRVELVGGRGQERMVEETVARALHRPRAALFHTFQAVALPSERLIPPTLLARITHWVVGIGLGVLVVYATISSCKEEPEEDEDDDKKLL